MTEFFMNIINPYLPTIIVIGFAFIASKWLIPWLKSKKYDDDAHAFALIARDMVKQYIQLTGTTNITVEILDGIIEKFIELTGINAATAHRIITSAIYDTEGISLNTPPTKSKKKTKK